jgi:sulfate permease, SulP family
MKKYFPILQWLPNYKKSYFKGDLSAGLTVGIMLIPQGMAYAMIAGLPPVYGLYAAMLPQVIYAIFGTSRQLAVGPVAMDSLLVATAVSSLAAVGTDQYLNLALLLAFIMGAIQVLFGVLKLGFLVNFLSKPVVNGFTSAAAIVIGLSQLKHLLGVKISANANPFTILFEAISSFKSYQYWTILLAISTFIMLKYVKKIHETIPGQLLAVAVGIGLVLLLDLDDKGVNVVGTIPGGFPKFAIHTFSWSTLEKLAPIALTLALIAFMEAISVATAIHAKHREEYQIEPNQELISLGMANVVSSFFGSYAVTGGFSRSAVNEQSGANTNLAALISASLVALVLLFFTSWFYFLPHAVLGVIIMMAVFGLIDFKFPVYLWRTHKQDFFMLFMTFVITLTVGIKEGIFVGVVLSLGLMIYRTTRPHVAELGPLPTTTEYRNVKRFPNIKTRSDVLVLRYDSQLYFANANHFQEITIDYLKEKPNCRLLVFDFGSVSHLDSTALQTLTELVSDLQKKGVMVHFSSIIGPVRDYLTKASFIANLGGDCFFVDIQSALDAFDNKQLPTISVALNPAIQSNIFGEISL